MSTHAPARSHLRSRRPRFAVIGTRGYPSYYGGFETLNRQLVPHALDAAGT